jgi:hypothetical protein
MISRIGRIFLSDHLRYSIENILPILKISSILFQKFSKAETAGLQGSIPNGMTRRSYKYRFKLSCKIC